MKWKLASIVAVLTLALAVALPLFAQEADEVEIEDDDIVWAGGWGHGGGHGDGPGKAMMEELALTKDQLKKMDEMRSTHRKEMIPIRAQLQVKQIELNELFYIRCRNRHNQQQDRRNQQAEDRHGQEESGSPCCNAPTSHARTARDLE